MKATPGPWKVSTINPYEYSIDAPNGEPDFGTVAWNTLAIVYGSEDEGIQGKHKGELNAAMISACPDMYSVLKRIESLECIEDEELFCDILSALAKADGYD